MFPKLPRIYRPCSHLQQTGHCRFNVYGSISLVGRRSLHLKLQDGGAEETPASSTGLALRPCLLPPCTALPLGFTYSLHANCAISALQHAARRGSAGRTSTGKPEFWVQTPVLPITHWPNQLPSLRLSLFICKLRGS